MAIRSFLYDAEGNDQPIELTDAQLHAVGEQQLLWIDVDEPEPEVLEHLRQLLGLDAASLRHLSTPNGSRVENFGSYIQFAVAAAPAAPADNGKGGHRREAAPDGTALVHFLVAAQWLLTVHDGPVRFIEEFCAQDRPETMIGALTTYDFTASLLDVHLEAFFDEVGRIEALVDRLDEQALINPSGRILLARLVALRRRVSRLRVLLSGQRAVFYGLSRPDLQTMTESGAEPHFHVLASRFERAIDEVEHSRDLVVGSFELFASRSSQLTNDLVKTLTYLTAVIGICAAVAGIFGMNFETGFFDTGDAGFYVTIVALAATIIIATIIARWRAWI